MMPVVYPLLLSRSNILQTSHSSVTHADDAHVAAGVSVNHATPHTPMHSPSWKGTCAMHLRSLCRLSCTLPINPAFHVLAAVETKSKYHKSLLIPSNQSCPDLCGPCSCWQQATLRNPCLTTAFASQQNSGPFQPNIRMYLMST